MVLLGLVIAALDSILAVGLWYGLAWLNAFGPAVLADGWTGLVIQGGAGLLAITIILVGAAHLSSVMDGFGRRSRPGFRARLVKRAGVALVIVGLAVAFFAPMVAMWTANDAVRAMAFERRGRTTECTILRIHKRVETTTDSDDNRTTQTFYDHDLACGVAEIRKMTTSDRPAAQPPQHLAVRYDPLGRLEPQPADATSHSGDLVRASFVALGIAVVTRSLLGFYAYRKDSVDYLELYSMMGPLLLFGLVQLGLTASTFWATDSVLARFGMDRQGVHGWRSWLVHPLLVVVTATVLAGSTGLAVKALTRFLPRDSIIRSWLEEIDISFSIAVGVGGIFVTADTGIVAMAGKHIRRLFRRRRSRSSATQTTRTGGAVGRGEPPR
jgi:hypothetical protein